LEKSNENKTRVRKQFEFKFICFNWCYLSNKELAEKFGWKENEPNLNANGKEYNLYDFVDDKTHGANLFYSGEDGIIGYIIAEGDDSDFGGPDISISEVIEKAKYVTETLNVPFEDIRIISGARYH